MTGIPTTKKYFGILFSYHNRNEADIKINSDFGARIVLDLFFGLWLFRIFMK